MPTNYLDLARQQLQGNVAKNNLDKKSVTPVKSTVTSGTDYLSQAKQMLEGTPATKKADSRPFEEKTKDIERRVISYKDEPIKPTTPIKSSVKPSISPDKQIGQGYTRAQDKVKEPDALDTYFKQKKMEEYNKQMAIQREMGNVDFNGNYTGPTEGPLKGMIEGAKQSWNEYKYMAAKGKENVVGNKADSWQLESSGTYKKKLEDNPDWEAADPFMNKPILNLNDLIQDFKSQPWKTTKRALRQAVELGTLQAAGHLYATKYSVSGGAGYAAITAMMGQMGPQAALPEELVTVPAAFVKGFWLGDRLGVGEFIALVEAGSAYDKYTQEMMLEEGTARIAAGMTGVVNAVLEEKLGVGLGKLPGFGKAVSAIASKSTKGLAKSIMKDVGMEALEEGVQSAVSNTFGEAGKLIEAGVYDKEFKETLLSDPMKTLRLIGMEAYSESATALPGLMVTGGGSSLLASGINKARGVKEQSSTQEVVNELIDNDELSQLNLDENTLGAYTIARNAKVVDKIVDSLITEKNTLDIVEEIKNELPKSQRETQNVISIIQAVDKVNNEMIAYKVENSEALESVVSEDNQVGNTMNPIDNNNALNEVSMTSQDIMSEVLSEITPEEEKVYRDYKEYLDTNKINQDEVVKGVKLGLKDLIDEQVNFLKGDMAKGVIPGGVKKNDQEEVVGRYPRVSRNSLWYRDFYAQNGRKPSNKQLIELAVKMLREGYDDEISGFIPANEEFIEMEGFLNEYDRFKQAESARQVSESETATSGENVIQEETRQEVNEESTKEDRGIESKPVSILNEGMARTHRSYNAFKPIIEIMKKNKAFNNLQISFIDRVEKIKMKREELDNAGYQNFEEKEYQNTGRYISLPNGAGQTVFFRGATLDTIAEESIHHIQRNLKEINPSLAEKIEKWEVETIQKANDMGIAIPEGYELFAQAFVATELNQADQYPGVAELISIPDNISKEFKALLGKDFVKAVTGKAKPQTKKKDRPLYQIKNTEGNIDKDTSYNAIEEKTIAKEVSEMTKNDEGIYHQLKPQQVMELNIPLNLPNDEIFIDAVQNTEGAKITEDGLLIDLVRFQSPEMEGEQSVRTGVFYLPAGSKDAKFYKGGKNGYGGNVMIKGETLLRRPLFAKGATGGKAPAVAYDSLKGKKAYDNMRNRVLSRLPHNNNKALKMERVDELLAEYGINENDTYDMAYNIVENSTNGNTLAYAIQENIVAHAVREAGYDSVVGYGKKKTGEHFISEVFDVRETTYPSNEFDSEVHSDFQNTNYQLKPTDTNSPKFKAWFGDSKVVNEDGSPKVVYHGTKKEFTVFQTKEGRNEGYYFTSEKKYANSFAGLKEDGKPYPLVQEDINNGYAKPNIMPVYLSVQNPLIITKDQVDIIEDVKYWDNIYNPIKEREYDGIILEGMEQIFVFEPTQIKSIYNEGTWDSNNADIRYQLRDPNNPPKKTIKAYKLLRVMKSKPGKLFPLFVDADIDTPIGVWLDAQEGATVVDNKGNTKVKSKLGPLAYRPGWHLGDLPFATHIGVKGEDGNIAYMNPEHVWVEAEVAADVDYQEEANQNGMNPKTGKINLARADIKKMPKDGFYRYKTNPNMTGNWIITGSLKINRILSDEEAAQIVRDAGFEPLPRHGGKIDLKSYGFDENISYQLKEEDTPKMKRRKFADTVAEAENTVPELADIIADEAYMYPVRSNERNEKGKRFIEKMGETDIINKLARKSMAVDEVVDYFDAGIVLIHKYQKEGDIPKAQAIFESVMEIATGLGQGVQILRTYAEFGVEAKLHDTVKKYEDYAKKHAPKAAQEINDVNKNIVDTMDQIHKDAAENMDTTDMVNEVKELTPEEMLAKRIAATLKEKNPSKEDNLVKQMIQTLFKLAKEEAPLPGESNKQNPLDVVTMAIQGRAEYRQVWNKAKELLIDKYGETSEEYQMLEPYFEMAINRTFPQSKLKQAVGNALKELNLKISDIVKQHYSVNSAMRTQIVEKLVAEAGLTGIESKILEDYIRNHLKDLTKEAKEKALTKLLPTTIMPKARKALHDRIMELSNLGGLDHREYRDLIADKMGLPTLTPELIEFIKAQSEKIQQMEDGPEKDVESAILLATIDAEIPPSLARKVNTMRIIAMLWNPITWVRNLIGNGLFAAGEGIKDLTTRPMVDYLHSVVTGEPRLHDFNYIENLRNYGKGFKRGWQDGYRDARLGIDTSNIATRYDIPKGRTFRGQKVLGSKAVGNALANLEMSLNVALRASDRAFFMAAFTMSIQEQIRIAKIETPNQEMIDWAVHEGLYKTFQDDTALSRTFTGLQKSLNNIGSKDFGFGNIIMPFPKTPANIVQRGIDYSPIMLIAAGIRHKADKTNSDYIKNHKLVEEVSRSLLGTAGIATVFALASLGVVTGEDDDNYDLYRVKQTAGIMNYQVNTSAMNRLIMNFLRTRRFEKQQFEPGDILINYDWAQPLAIDMAIGANIALETNPEDGILNVLQIGATSGLGTLTDQPLIQGLKELFAYGDIPQGIMTTIQSIPNSFVPSFLGRIARLIDADRRSTYDPNTGMKILREMGAKVPGLSKTLEPQLDAWGKEIKSSQAPGILKLPDLILNPAFVRKYNPDENTQMILDMYKSTGDTRVVPFRVRKEQTMELIDGSRQTIVLTPKEMTAIQRFVGEEIQREFKEIRGYVDRLPDDTMKVREIDRALDNARDAMRERIKQMRGLN